MSLVMFDLDGTLVDTVEELTQAVNLTLADFGQVNVDESQVRTWIGQGTASLMQHAQQGAPHLSTFEVLSRFKQHYIDVVGTSSQLYPMVEETLQLLRASGIKLAIITNKEQTFTDQVLRQHDLTQYFDLVISGDSLEVKKPDRKVVDFCLQILNKQTTNSLFVGDSATDIATARNAGVICWTVPYGYNNGRDIELDKPDRVIENISLVGEFFNNVRNKR